MKTTEPLQIQYYNMAKLMILGNLNLFHTKFNDIIDKYHYIPYDLRPWSSPMVFNIQSLILDS